MPKTITISTNLIGEEDSIAMPQCPSSASISLCCTLIYPSSPQLVPHELFTSQCSVPSSSSPYPNAVTPFPGENTTFVVLEVSATTGIEGDRN
ncbi:hypothetical protein V6N13_084447 [Hibiscus sabdariffa]|uniref:Uncharacterized protein n=1 Tax=Hibiscus sabdariffa TaxID=183260 RepID=A0ABR2T1S0_9ROSI